MKSTSIIRKNLSEKVILPTLNPKSAIFGFTNALDHNYLLVNLLVLTFK